MKLSESRDPQTNDELANGVGDGRGGSEGLGGATFGEQMVETAEGALRGPGGAVVDDR